jgi:hypothetical protein
MRKGQAGQSGVYLVIFVNLLYNKIISYFPNASGIRYGLRNNAQGRQKTQSAKIAREFTEQAGDL